MQERYGPFERFVSAANCSFQINSMDGRMLDIMVIRRLVFWVSDVWILVLGCPYTLAPTPCLFQFLLQQVVQHLRVCLAFGSFHRLAHKEAEEFLVAGPEPLGLFLIL